MRLVFMGTPDFAACILKKLLDAGHEVVAVYSQPPRPSGRGKRLRQSPVQALAEELGLKVEAPLSFREPVEVRKFREWEADVAVVVAYGLILPSSILEAPARGCINIHASLLPRWRGAAPIQRAIEAGDTSTGISLVKMDAGLDTGPQIELHDFNRFVSIDETTTYRSLHDKLMILGSAAIVKLLRQERWPLEAQSGEGVSYAHKIDKKEARLDWSEPAELIARKIRAFSPTPGAFCLRGDDIKNSRLKLLMARAEPCPVLDRTLKQKQPHELVPGMVLDQKFSIACGEGVLRVETVKPEGKGPMSSQNYLCGKPLAVGSVLS